MLFCFIILLMQLRIENTSLNLNKRFLLKDINLTIKPNDYLTILGANGSGKTILAKILSGLIKPSFGNIYLNNIPINEKNFTLLQKTIGIVFQNPESQFISFTGKENLIFCLENNQKSIEEIDLIVSKTIKSLNLESFINFPIQKLSGGQLQKLAIATQIILDKKILIFDEVTSMLDTKKKKKKTKNPQQPAPKKHLKLTKKRKSDRG